VPPLGGFTQTLPFSPKCATDLLCAHHPLPVFSCVPPQCAFNATFHVGFRPAHDQLPPHCRHPHCLLSLFFLWLFFRFCLYLLVFPLLFPCTFSSVCSFYLVIFPILPVFTCFSIAISLYVFFCLFLLFGCFSDFACICLFFHYYFPVRFLLFVPFIWLFFHFCPFISLYVFYFLFLLVIRLYPLKLFSAYEYICI
jgi:hypothetical protein